MCLLIATPCIYLLSVYLVSCFTLGSPVILAKIWESRKGDKSSLHSTCIKKDGGRVIYEIKSENINPGGGAKTFSSSSCSIAAPAAGS